MNAGRARAAAIFLLSSALCGCGRNDDDTKLPLKDSLDICSPFESFDHQREITFRDDMTVQLSEVLPSPEDKPGTTILDAKKQKTSDGSYSTDDASRTLTVQLAGIKHQYHYIEPDEGLQCILVFGELKSADLTQSWFGTPTQDSDSDSRDYP